MTGITDKKTLIVEVAFKLTPPLIRESLLDKQKFREEYGFVTEGTVYFSNNVASFHRSVIFDAIREASDEEPVEVPDKNGQIWKLTIDKCDQELTRLLLSLDQQQLFISDLLSLSADPTTRICFFDEMALDVNLPIDAQEKWRNILTERALEDDEVEVLQRDIRDTPMHVMRAIRNEITEGTGNISSLVPSSRRYYERLVGVYDRSNSILDYAAKTGSEFFEQLLQWQPYDGFLFSLLLSSHSSLTAEICVDHLEKEDLEKALNYLDKHGDLLSQLGAFEVGLRILPDRPELEPLLLLLVKKFEMTTLRIN